MTENGKSDAGTLRVKQKLKGKTELEQGQKQEERKIENQKTKENLKWLRKASGTLDVGHCWRLVAGV